MTILTVLCARSKSSYQIRLSCTAPKGIATSSLSLQYHPPTNIFCSSCRRRDSTPTPTSMTFDVSAPFLSSTMHKGQSASLPDPLPRLRPTTVNGIKLARIPPHFHQGTADLDPTEWKPADTRSESDDDPPLKTGASTPVSDSGRISLFGGSSTSLVGSWKPKLEHRPSSEASNYLGQFHRSSDNLTNAKRRLPRAAESLISRATPGLSHSPTVSSTGSEESLSGTPYELVMRPRAASRPTSAVSKSHTQAEGLEVSYEKQSVPTVVDPNLRSASGSLKNLLAGAKKAGPII